AIRRVARMLCVDSRHVSNNSSVPNSRTIRSRIPDASGSLFHRREHCWGGGKPRTRGVSTVSRYESGVAFRTVRGDSSREGSLIHRYETGTRNQRGMLTSRKSNDGTLQGGAVNNPAIR